MLKNRRQFIADSFKITGIISIGSTLTKILQSCEYDEEIATKPQGIILEFDLNTDSELSQLLNNSGIQRADKRVNLGIPFFIIKLANEKFVSFSALCTHQSCLGKDLWAPKMKAQIRCTCHGSVFDCRNGGKPVEGPAERALRQFPTRFDPDKKILYIEF